MTSFTRILALVMFAINGALLCTIITTVYTSYDPYVPIPWGPVSLIAGVFLGNLWLSWRAM